MLIHTVKDGESVAGISKQYGIDEEILRMNNYPLNGECAEGEELLVITPTRTYTLKKGDSPERLALRFGIRRREISAMNPWIEETGFLPGRKLALKCDGRKYGMAAANGYFYNGCSLTELRKKLSYFTYMTVGACFTEKGEIYKCFDPRDAVGIARSADKIPLMRVFNRDGDIGNGLTDEIIGMAISGGYKGITLGGVIPSADFIVELRKKMIGCDLILITEVNESSSDYCSEYSDGSIFSFSKYKGTKPRGSGEEISAYKKYATDAESSRTFIELPVFAVKGCEAVTVDEAIGTARTERAKVTQADGINEFRCRKGYPVYYPTLESIKATLDTVHEYGFMGISFDIMRVPLSYLAMYNALFGTSSYTCVRSKEGCSRER